MKNKTISMSLYFYGCYCYACSDHITLCKIVSCDWDVCEVDLFTGYQTMAPAIEVWLLSWHDITLTKLGVIIHLHHRTFFTLLLLDSPNSIHHEGNRAHPGRTMWQPNWCQGKYSLCNNAHV